MPREYPEYPEQSPHHTPPASTTNHSSSPAVTTTPAPVSRGSSISNCSVNRDHGSEIDGNDGRVLTNGYHWDEEEDIEQLWMNRPTTPSEHSLSNIYPDSDSDLPPRTPHAPSRFPAQSDRPGPSRIPRMTNGIFNLQSNSSNSPPQPPPMQPHPLPGPSSLHFHTQHPQPPPFQSSLPPWFRFHTYTQPPPSYSHPPPTHILPSPSAPSSHSLPSQSPYIPQPPHHTQPVIPSLDEFEQRIESARLRILQADYEIRAAERRREAAQRDMAVAALDMLSMRGVGFRVGEGWMFGTPPAEGARLVDGSSNGGRGGVVNGTGHGSSSNDNDNDNDNDNATNVSATNNADTANAALINGVPRFPGERDAEVPAPFSNDEWLSSSSEESVDEDE